MADRIEPSPASSQRLVRVFVSSTFRDMHGERDELVKFTFPELRRRCRERAVEFVEVDLRWGITDEEKSEGKVLPICLAEIDRCRPYFIGLLAERYGWVPEEIDEELARQQEWLLEHKEKSVTELEIVHGVLRNLAMRGLAFFYFRDPESSRRVEEELACLPDYRPEPSSTRERLNSLKEKIRKSGYTVHEGFADPKTLGSRILGDLWEVIDKRFPLEKVPTLLERERKDHEMFAATRTKVYIGRGEYFRRLEEHVAGEDPPLVLLGESGSGKSALLANWVSRYREAHPDDFLVAHYIGSSADSTDPFRILWRVIEEIQARYNDPSEGLQERGEAETPINPQKVVEAFSLWVAKAAARGKFVLILDALNQLEDRGNALDLGWLPGYFPPGVRVVLSTLPGRSLEALKRMGWPSYSVLPLVAAERKKLIEEYLSRFGRKLSGDHAERIASASQSSNPLYLRALLDELRLYGDHHTLGLRIDHYLAAETVDALYDRILERYEQDYDRERPGLVRDAMTLLWASRRGLTEVELLDLLGKGSEPLPRPFWSPLLLAVDDAFVSRSGLLNFFHDFLRNAVEERYLVDPGVRRHVHLRLADYFALPEPDHRKADELPWQLSRAEEWKRLKDCLADLPTFIFLFRYRRELVDYWISLKGRYDMVDSYLASLEKIEGSVSETHWLFFLVCVASFVAFADDKYSIFEDPLVRFSLAFSAKVLGPEGLDTITSTITSINPLYLKYTTYDPSMAIKRYRLAKQVKVSGVDDPEIIQHSNIQHLFELARIFRKKGEHEESAALYKRGIEVCQNYSNIQHLFDWAQDLRDKGEHRESAALYKRVIEVCETMNLSLTSTFHKCVFLMAAAHNNIAFHTDVPSMIWKDAEEHYKRSIELLRQLGNSIETANVELNLLTMHWLAGHEEGNTWPKVDVARVKELTRILDEAGDHRAKKGHKLIKKMKRGRK